MSGDRADMIGDAIEGGYVFPRQDEEIAVPSLYAREVVRFAPEKGIDRLEMFRVARIDPQVLDGERLSITAEQYSNLLSATMVAMGDEMLGHGPAEVVPGSWNVMCHSLIHCETLGDALRRFCKFFALFRNGLQPTLVIQEDGARLEIRMPESRPDFVMSSFGVELTIFLIHRFINWLTKELLPLNTLSAAMPPPPHAAVMREYFVTTLIQFDAKVTSIAFDRSYLQRRLKQDRHNLDRMLRQGYLELFTTQYPSVSWSARIKSILGRDLVETPELEAIGKMLAIHPQTLRRRLAEEGVTFRQLRADVRKEAALLLLESTSLSIDEISVRVGFSQASAFTRAFREWTGSPPNRFRAESSRR